ncbi:hypothetical protein BAUCODRAFT_121016 [Baudoinia panamericana UAMH 10762]|uniref:Uncharacterized protein n=1 Tax=Baudoinia panamericana (strain UAMH 10762) TaxID=717646 RepID=M2NFS6_BAUPA|nr:uncharacterized protein BAUCODRAFT_121016 [Baudoinia panamericana UAMH 10762]EMC98114.1 hypothetical protein BAUCODRAFT_121016 [Baudoinia panamericana UAMH 10762]
MSNQLLSPSADSQDAQFPPRPPGRTGTRFETGDAKADALRAPYINCLVPYRHCTIDHILDTVRILADLEPSR